jgi:hypothetical protein
MSPACTARSAQSTCRSGHLVSQYGHFVAFYQLLDGVVIDDTDVFNDKLREWENFYNHRPNGGLGGQTPYERLKQRTQTRV